MKMSAELFEDFRSFLSGAITSEIIELYETGQFCASDRVKDLNLRFRWDMFWSLVAQDHTTGVALMNRAYDDEDLNDDHIDTAFRKIFPTITRRY